MFYLIAKHKSGTKVINYVIKFHHEREKVEKSLISHQLKLKFWGYSCIRFYLNEFEDFKTNVISENDLACFKNHHQFVDLFVSEKVPDGAIWLKLPKQSGNRSKKRLLRMNLQKGILLD